ncbi:MAG: hypothetical protein ACXVZ2_09675 [Gaiellaceae bacterium]
MSLGLLIIVAGAVTYVLGRRWAVAIAPVIGLAVGAVIVVTGGSLRDTPLPFAVALATIASACALVLGRRLTSAR